MTIDENLDWLYRLRSEIHVYMPKEWLFPMYNAIETAIKALKQEPCGDAISRQAALDAMCALCNTGETLKENPWRDNPHIDAIIDALDNLPPITPQQKIGRWIEGKCDQCGKHAPFWSMATTYYESEYCPKCGAKMQEVKE